MTYVKKASFLKLKAEIIKEQIHQTTIPDKNIEPIEKIGKYEWEVTSLIKQLEEKIKDVKSILETSCALQREVSKLSKNIEEQFRQLKLHPKLTINQQKLKKIERYAVDIFRKFENLNQNANIIESNSGDMSTLKKKMSNLQQSVEQKNQIIKERQKFNEDLLTQLQDINNSTEASSFKLDLTLARGHIDLKRLKLSVERIKV